MTETAAMTVLQVDPSLFTAPYDKALSQGLRANGVAVRWATRGLRPGEEDGLRGEDVARIFYPITDGGNRRTGRAWQALKGVEHVIGLGRLRQMAASGAFDLVHFQWAPLPIFDRRAIAAIGRRCPVVLTVHDAVPFNGKAVGRLQAEGQDALLAGVDHLIVHGEAGRQALLARGLPADRISIVAHGMLPLPDAAPEPRPDPSRWRIVQFGKIQDYKGVDILIEALGLLAPADRERIEVIVAGEPMIDMEPVIARARALGLRHSIAFRTRRLTEAEMAALLCSGDAFVFPYRAIEASGVLHLVAGLDRWLIASDIGAFRGLIGGRPGAGELVRPADPSALAGAIADSIGRRPAARPDHGVPGWDRIGEATCAIYRRLIAGRGHAPALGVAA